MPDLAANRALALRIPVVLTDPGPREAEVVACLVAHLKFKPCAARRLIDDAPRRLTAPMPGPAARRLAALLTACGAEISLGGLDRLREEAEAGRVDLHLANVGPDPEATAAALAAATRRDRDAADALVAAVPVIVADAVLPARARRIIASLSAAGASAEALLSRPACPI